MSDNPAVEEAEEVALNSWLSVATYRRAVAHDVAQNNGELGPTGSDEQLSKASLAWTTATLKASQIMQNMSEMVSKAVGSFVRREQPPAASTLSLPSTTTAIGSSPSPDDTRKRKRESPPPPLPGGRRFDYVIPMVDLLDSIQHEYFSGLRAHFAYWSNIDFAFFILQKLKDNGG